MTNYSKYIDDVLRPRITEKAVVPVTLPSGHIIELSAGEHNILQKRIIEDFLPEFGMGAQVLYVGDTSDKNLFRDEKKLQELNFFALEHDELPDIVAYSEEKSLLLPYSGSAYFRTNERVAYCCIEGPLGRLSSYDSFLYGLS